MSRSTQQLKELTTGVHLVIIDGFTAVKNPDGSLMESPTGEKRITVRFTNHENKSFDKGYWVMGEREKEFNKMIAIAGIDKSKYSSFKLLGEASKGARLWISIKEVHHIDGDKEVGEVDYYIFDYDPCLNPEKKPNKKGNPQDNKGVASDAFLDYKQVSKSVIEKNIPMEEAHNNLALEIEKDAIAKMEKELDHIKDFAKEKADKAFTDFVVLGKAKIEKEEPFDVEFGTETSDDFVAPVIDKKEVIAKAKEMIKKVESGVKTPKSDSDSINWDDYK